MDEKGKRIKIHYGKWGNFCFSVTISYPEVITRKRYQRRPLTPEPFQRDWGSILQQALLLLSCFFRECEGDRVNSICVQKHLLLVNFTSANRKSGHNLLFDEKLLKVLSVGK